MIITIILFGISNVYARETIKTCWVNDVWKGKNNFVFPKDGGKPYGNEVAILLSMTNALNLEIEFIEEKEHKDGFLMNCFIRLRDGTIDIMLNQDDIHQAYAVNVPYFKGPKGWGLPGNKHLNFVISKKSKFFPRIEEFKRAVLTQKEYNKILHATYTSANHHDWPSEETQVVKQVETQALKKEKGISEGEFELTGQSEESNQIIYSGFKTNLTKDYKSVFDSKDVNKISITF